MSSVDISSGIDDPVPAYLWRQRSTLGELVTPVVFQSTDQVYCLIFKLFFFICKIFQICNVRSQQTEEKWQNNWRIKKEYRKVTLGDFLKVQSTIPKQIDQKSGLGWKNAQRKNKISTNKVEKDNAKLKKAVNDVKERKYQINSEFLSFNRYSILENEELIEELTDHGSCETIKITYKALHKKKSKGNRNQGKNTVGSADSNSSEGIYPEVLRCKKCFHSHFPSRKVCKLNM